MLRRTILQAAFGKAKRRPNIVFVLADQWRAQAFGYMGDPNAATPNLDAFSKQSFEFTQAVSGFPVCSPYRASLMTGQYAVRNGMVVNDIELKPNGATLGESFRKAGYATGYIGKWHVYGSPQGQSERRLQYIPETHRMGFDYWKVCECTHNYNRSLYYEANDRTARYWDGYDAIPQTDDACEYIRRQSAKSDPYFLVLSLGPPHDPYETAPAKYRDAYAQRDMQLRPNVPDSHRQKATKDLRGYYAHSAAIDDCFGRIQKAVQESGAADDTILIFTSDHGDMLESHGLRLKHLPWEESLRVPFLLQYPGLLGRKRRSSIAPIDAPDIMPTLLGLSGLPVPESVQGTNFAPVIEGKRKVDSEAASLLNLPVTFFSARRAGFAEYRGLRTQRHTYVRSIQGPWLLYDNQQDPYQKQNLVERNVALRSRLDRKLDSMLRRIGDEFLPGKTYAERAQASHYKEVVSPIGKTVSPWGDWRSTIE